MLKSRSIGHWFCPTTRYPASANAWKPYSTTTIKQKIGNKC